MRYSQAALDLYPEMLSFASERVKEAGQFAPLVKGTVSELLAAGRGKAPGVVKRMMSAAPSALNEGRAIAGGAGGRNAYQATAVNTAGEVRRKVVMQKLMQRGNRQMAGEIAGDAYGTLATAAHAPNTASRARAGLDVRNATTDHVMSLPRGRQREIGQLANARVGENVSAGATRAQVTRDAAAAAAAAATAGAPGAPAATKGLSRGAIGAMGAVGAVGAGAGAYGYGRNIQKQQDKSQRNLAFGAGTALGLAAPKVLQTVAGGLNNIANSPFMPGAQY